MILSSSDGQFDGERDMVAMVPASPAAYTQNKSEYITLLHPLAEGLKVKAMQRCGSAQFPLALAKAWSECTHTVCLHKI